jgi:hypothetical protein
MLNLFAASLPGSSLVTNPTPDPTGPEIDVYVILGQSNAAGRGYATSLSSANQQPIEGALVYDHLGGKTLQPMQAGINTQSDQAGRFGAEVGFALARKAHTARPFCILKYAVGGTMLFQGSGSDWNAASSELAKTARDMIAAGMQKLREAGYNPVIKSVFWHQGESDNTDERRAVYAANMASLVSYMDQNADLNAAKWVICRLFENSAGKDLVNAAKLEHINTNPTRFLWQSPVEQYARISGSDTTHANHNGLLAMGTDWHELVKTL